MTTPSTPALEERVTILETRLDAILPTLATKADIAEVRTEIAEVRIDIVRLEGKMDAMNKRLEGKINAVNEINAMNARIDAAGNRLFIKLGGMMVAVAAVAVAAAKYL